MLLDEAERLKKGVVNPYLVPDLAISDPELTLTMPPTVTAATGIDALVHCMEAHANKFAHVSTHVSLRKAIEHVQAERILAVVRLAYTGVRKLGVADPHIAIAGLNPHAGEGGLFGEEEARHTDPST
jgi:alcohol dehydrogenase class IV